MRRRKFLRALGWTAGGLTVLGFGGRALVPPLPTFGKSKIDDAVTWVSLKADGSIHFLLPRAEMGQGIDTGLTQIVAEELRVSPATVRCVYQRTDRMDPCQMTVGSQSIEHYATLTARAAAALRETLIARARTSWSNHSGALNVADGRVVRSAGESLAFATLLTADEDAVVIVDADTDAAKLYSAQPASARHYVGHPARGQHIREIVTGRERFSRDVVVPGMKFGAVLAPPRLGATLMNIDPSAASQVAGFVGVIEGPDGAVGLVADTPHALSQALEAVKATWHEPDDDNQAAAATLAIDIDQMIAADALDHMPTDSGDVEPAKQAAAVSLSLRYDSPMAAHAAMEPRAGVARWSADGDQCEVWTGSQDPWLVRASIADATGTSPDDVTVYNHRIGGAFGGRSLCQASVQAAWIARGTGHPVKVQWSREEEFRYNYVGPQFSTRVDAGLDANGRLAYWHHRMAGAPVLTSSMFIPDYLHRLADLLPDPGTARGTQLPYDVANHKVEFADVRLPMPTGPWRGLGAAANTFAIESAMDELALAAQADPIDFRLQHARAPRLAGVLSRLRAQLKASDAGPVGIAATVYKGVTFVAAAVEMERDVPQPRVKRIWCVHDCGDVIAPDQVRAQIEGNLAWGVSMALLESYEFANGIGATDNFHNYAIARMHDIPALHIELVDSAAPASGAGEAAIAPVAAAIANALYRTTGKRHRQLPVRYA